MSLCAGYVFLHNFGQPDPIQSSPCRDMRDCQPQANPASEKPVAAFDPMSNMWVFILQLVIIACSFGAVLLWLLYFPYPSPLTRHFLPPRLRWPEAQIRDWLDKKRLQRSFLHYFYRDPERDPPPGDELLAPADGLVTSADIRDGICYMVIALSFWDMHVQRSPVSGTVTSVSSAGDTYMDGEGRQFAFLREKSCPVQMRITMQTKFGVIAVRLITSLAARRIETWVKSGQPVTRGERIGRILLGSTVVLELPSTADVLASPGVRVWAGETRVARFPT